MLLVEESLPCQTPDQCIQTNLLEDLQLTCLSQLRCTRRMEVTEIPAGNPVLIPGCDTMQLLLLLSLLLLLLLVLLQFIISEVECRCVHSGCYFYYKIPRKLGLACLKFRF